MKRYRLIQTSCLVAVALGFAACSQDELSSPTGGVEGAPVTFTATGIATPKVETRSTIDGTWDDGLTVGVKIDGTVKAYAATPDAADSKTATLAAAQGVTPFLWASSNETKAVEAWYPYTAGETTAPALVVKEDQRDEANYLASDLLSASATVSVGNTELQFNHRTAKITIHFIKQDSSLDLGNAMVWQDNHTTENGNPSSIHFFNASAGDSYTYHALIAPQTFAAGSVLFYLILDNGQVLSYTSTDALECEAGNQYVFTVEIIDGRLKVQAPGVLPWESGSSATSAASPDVLGEGDYYINRGDVRHYYVRTEVGLKAWAQYVSIGNWSANCTLLDDITMTKNEDGSSNWNPVGRVLDAASNWYLWYTYEGTFDGAGHTIDNMVVDHSAVTWGGVASSAAFIYMLRGTIQDLTIGENSTFICGTMNHTSSTYAASFAGWFVSGKIINCHSKATIKGSYIIGGIVGDFYGKVDGLPRDDKSQVIGCSFSGTIQRNYPVDDNINNGGTGGIIGRMYANAARSVRLVGCYSTGTIINDLKCRYVGGIVGQAYTDREWNDDDFNASVSSVGCYSTGRGLSSVTSATYVGGVIGHVTTSGEEIGKHEHLSSYWSDYSGAAVGQSDVPDTNATLSLGFVDGSNINWETATADMNAAIKTWNADNDNLCIYHYEQTNGTNNPPTLVEGAPN